MYAGVPLNNQMYDVKVMEDGTYCTDDWFSAKPTLKNVNPLVNLPYVMEGDVVVSQTNACLTYLGRRLGLWGKSLEEQCECEQLLCEVMDLRNTMTRFAYGPGNLEAAKQTIAYAQGKNGCLQKFELWLERNSANSGEGVTDLSENAAGNGAFLVGKSATAPDFHLYEMLVQFTELAKYHNLPVFLGSYPRLLFFMNAFEKLPGNARYMATLGALCPRALPFNQKSAGFGATLNNDKWVVGAAYDFDKLSGVY